MTVDHWQRRLIANGALVFLLGLAAGFPFAFIILGKVSLWPIPGELHLILEDALQPAQSARLAGYRGGTKEDIFKAFVLARTSSSGCSTHLRDALLRLPLLLHFPL